MRRHDLVIFDLDGTLADTRGAIVRAANHTMRELELPEHTSERVTSFVGQGPGALIERALGPTHQDAEQRAHALEIFTTFYAEHMLDGTQPYPGMLDVLDALQAAGVALCVATNKPAQFAPVMVEALFPQRFSPIVACGGEVPAKPDPTCIALCRSMHPGIADARVLIVGDSDVDVETARSAGIDALAITWGYQPRERLVAARPRWLRDHVHEIAKLVLEGE